MSKQSLRGSVAWLFAGSIGNQVLTFATGVVLARLLMPADFGLLLTVQVFTGIAGLIATGGMGQALVRAERITRSDTNVIFTIQFGVGLAFFLFLYSIAPFFADLYGAPIYGELLRISALTFIIRPFANTPGALLQREMRFKAKALIGMVVLLTSSTASISMALLDLGVYSLVWGGICGALMNATLSAYHARWLPGINLQLSQARSLAQYGGMVTLNNLFFYARSQTTNFLISLYQAPVFLGLFNKADSLRTLPNQMISGSIYQVSFRALSKVQDDLPEARRLFLRALFLGWLYLFPIYTALFFAASPFIDFVYGKHWQAAGPALSLFALSGPLLLLSNQCGAVLEACNRLPQELRLQTEVWIIQLALLFALLLYAPSINNLALGLTALAAYNTLRMLGLAMATLQLDWPTLRRTLAPVLAINAGLILLAAGFDLLLAGLKGPSPFFYLAAFLPLTGVAYAVLTLTSSTPEIKEEATRWLKRVRR
ncbi:MAG: lipopolysaccharide biosynthesis protein [Pseudomonadota bacterium]